MRYLGLDLGTKTLGVAVSDLTGTIATSLTILRHENNHEYLIEELKKIISEKNVETIVLGLPKNMDSSEGFAADRSKTFSDLLKKHIDIPITFIDERLSSVEAHNILFNLGKNNQKRKKVVDEIAATIILENFMKKRGN